MPSILTHDVRHKQAVRDQLQQDVEAFLAWGGRKEELPASFSDPGDDDSAPNLLRETCGAVPAPVNAEDPR